MERQTSKRKRVFSLEPSKNPKVIFARKYTGYLVPALKKINTTKPSSEINGHDRQANFEQTVKHEVEMALALSAQEFAWSRFLQQKLSFPDDSTRGSTPCSSIPKQNIDVDGSKNLERSDEQEDEDEEGEISKRLRELQKLLPGGDEMGVEEMLSEIGSYIVCLELQMIVLKSLVEEI